MTNSQPTQSTYEASRITPKCTKIQESRQELSRPVAVSFVAQAVLLDVMAIISVLSGTPLLLVILSMIAQGIYLLIDAHRAEISLKESDRKSRRSEL